MPRRKTFFDEISDVLIRIGLIYILLMVMFWFSNKQLFWKMLVWGLIIYIISIVIFLFIKESKIHKQSQWRTDGDLLLWLRNMKPTEFEDYTSDLFSKLGYNTQSVGGSYDGGVDVIAEKDGVKYYIQCKKYITSTVGVKEIREFYGVLVDHLAKGKGFFITTNKFTLEAERFAEGKPIELIDGFKLIKYVRLSEKSMKKNRNKSLSQMRWEIKRKKGKVWQIFRLFKLPKMQIYRKYQKIIKSFIKNNKKTLEQ